MAAKRVESFRVPCLDAGSTPATSTKRRAIPLVFFLRSRWPLRPVRWFSGPPHGSRRRRNREKRRKIRPKSLSLRCETPCECRLHHAKMDSIPFLITYLYEKDTASGLGRTGQGVRDCGSAAGPNRRGMRQICGSSRDAGGRRLRGLRHARRRRTGGGSRQTPSRCHRSRNRGYPHRTSLRFRTGRGAGGTERPGREFHDEPQGHPRPGGQGTGIENRPLFLCHVVGVAAGRRKDRLPLRGETADVLLGQRSVGGEGSRRAGTGMALRLRRFARRHPRTDRRGVHPFQQRNHAADRYPEERPDAVLPADRPCAEGRRLPRELPVSRDRSRTPRPRRAWLRPSPKRSPAPGCGAWMP